MTSETVKQITLTEEELAKIITSACLVFCKGISNKQFDKEEALAVYESTAESIKGVNLHEEFLEGFDNIVEFLSGIEYVPDAFENLKKEQANE